MDESKVVGKDGRIKPEAEAAAKELVVKVAELCKDVEPAIVLFVLEAALTAQIKSFLPPLGDMFRDMMRAYKSKAAVLIQMVEMLRDGGMSIEDLMAAGDEISPEAEEPLESI